MQILHDVFVMLIPHMAGRAKVKVLPVEVFFFFSVQDRQSSSYFGQTKASTGS